MVSGNDMAEAEVQTDQPADSVPAEAEEQTPAQGQDSDQGELYVEVEGDQPEAPNKSEMSDKQLRAAWKEEKRKRKEKSEQTKQLLDENEQLRKRVEDISKTVGDIQRGKKPDPTEFHSADDFYKALDEWQGSGKKEPSPKAPPAGNANKIELSEDQEWHLKKSEDAIKGSLKDYDDAKGRVSESLSSAFGVKDNSVFDTLVQMSHAYGIDPAKAMYALDKTPNRIKDLVANANNTLQVVSILRDLESKVKTRQQKLIDSEPEPSISGSGPVDNVQKEVENARKKYAQTGSMQDYNALKAAKAKIKVN